MAIVTNGAYGNLGDKNCQPIFQPFEVSCLTAK